MDISEKSRDLIVVCEVGDMSWLDRDDAITLTQRQYEHQYQRPTWPQGKSGVTIGIGYDLGYETPQQVRLDWVGLVSDEMIDAMVGCCGAIGEHAHNVTLSVKSHILIPWDAAIKVFDEQSVPHYEGLTRTALPNFDGLSPDCKGVLTSLTYNRGSSYVIPSSRDPYGRYKEMRAIRQHMVDKDFSSIPGEIRAMKRLWPGVGGLLKRREREAALFEQGLA